MDRSLYYVLSKNDISKVTDVLTKAFDEDDLINYLVNYRKKKIKHFFNLLVKIGVRYGQVVGTSANLEGVAIWLDSNIPIGLLKEIRCGGLSLLYRLGIKSFKRCMDLDTLVSQLHKKHMDTQHYIYLIEIGVDPIYQGKGFASKLLKNKFNDSEKESLPIFLETQKQENVSLYKHLGFKVIDEVVIPKTNIDEWCMVRYP